MFGRIVQLLTALSLLLCIAAAMLWGRSGGDGEQFGWRSAPPAADRPIESEYVARSVGGRFQFVCYGKSDKPAPLPAVTVTETSAKAQKAHTPARTAARRGFFWESLTPTKSDPARAGTVPPAEQEPSAFRTYDEVIGSTHARGVLLPYWFLMAVTALLPVRGLWSAVQTARQARDPHDPNPDHVPFFSRVCHSVASGFAVLAFLLTCLWVRSWYVGDRVSWGVTEGHGSSFVDLHSGKGEFVLHSRRVEGKSPRPAGRDEASLSDGLHWRSDADATVGYTAQTFAFDQENQAGKEGSVHATTFAAPFWALVILTLLVPVWWLRRLKYGPMNVMEIGASDRKPGPHAPAVSQRPL